MEHFQPAPRGDGVIVKLMIWWLRASGVLLKGMIEGLMAIAILFKLVGGVQVVASGCTMSMTTVTL